MVQEKEHYTFGDSDLAAERLRLLARVFEPGSTRLLSSLTPIGGAVALDLGCGPGHTTRLLAAHSDVSHVIGLDQSPRLLEAAAREQADPRLSFALCDVTSPPFPAPRASILYSRFLLTHLRNPTEVVRAWASTAVAGARLVLEETASMTAEHAALRRYYALVERMQAHYGQRMYVGRELAALGIAAAPEWRIERSETAVSSLPATHMARLHLLNLQTLSQDAFVRENFDARELAELSAELARIASGAVCAAPVSLGMGQLVLRRS
jgi:trans-aconitate 2-methyltransferase